MSEDSRPTQKYADLYRKCSRDYYHRHKEAILAKKKEQYALMHPLSERSKNKKDVSSQNENKVKKNYYKEVYKPRIQKQRLERLKEELMTKSVEEILEKFNIYEKKTEE